MSYTCSMSQDKPLHIGATYMTTAVILSKSEGQMYFYFSLEIKSVISLYILDFELIWNINVNNWRK